MRFTGRILIGALVVSLACGGDENAPPVPSGMTLTSGNNQSGLPGTPLPQPLTVTVTGAGGAPYPGVRVTWTVTTGAAGLSSPIDTTDVNGVSSTNVTVGTTPGNLVITANVTGVPAVPFSLTTLDPCDVTTTMSTDTTRNGVLTNFDCQFNGPFFTDFYSFVLPAQAGVLVSMNAVFDTYVEQYHLSGPFISLNDDQDSVVTNSRLNVIAAAGTYVLAASTFAGNVTGPYTITVAPRTQSVTGCRGENFLPWITRGVAMSESVDATDCTTIRTGGGRAFSDRVLIVLTPVRTLNVSVASAAFNPRLELYVQTTAGPTFTTAQNGSGGSVTLTHTPAAAAVFRLEITTVDTAFTGAYTLNEASTPPLAGEVIMMPFGNTTKDRVTATLEAAPTRRKN
jgi:hypothetical protein